MKKNTFKNYKEAIQHCYQIAKHEDPSGILLNPSPAQMRTLCLLIFDSGISKIDETILRVFFETKENESLRKSIENCNIDRFRPIISFLRSESDTENSIRIETSAILINFENRPYSVFSRDDRKANLNAPTRIDDFKNNSFEQNVVQNFSNVTTQPISKKGYRNRIIIGGLTVLSLFGIRTVFFKEKECMEWKENHYELIDCQDEQLGIVSLRIIKPFNEHEFKRRELTVSDTTRFFYGDKTLVWYSKKNNEVTFFNMDGENPENGAELRKVTPHIIEKYVYK